MAMPATPDPHPRRTVRLSDADRDRAVELLRDHYSDGRLSLEELLHRLPVALAAHTDAELRPLFADLPAVAPAVPPRPARRRGRRGVLAVVSAGVALTAVGWVVGDPNPAPPATSSAAAVHVRPKEQTVEVLCPADTSPSAVCWSPRSAPDEIFVFRKAP